LRVNSTSPDGKSSPLVFARQPSTRSAPKAFASASFFHMPF
jgi:hypothetical protein